LPTPGVIKGRARTSADVWNFILIRHDLDDGGNPGAADAPVEN